MRKATDEQIIAAHKALCERLHRPPTAPELGRMIGIKSWYHAKKWMDRLGLEQYRITKRECAQVAIDKRKAEQGKETTEVEDAIKAKNSVRLRIREMRAEIQMDEWRPAGADYDGQILTTRCEICTKPITIRPRLHPYYVRKADGGIGWLCCAECSGIMLWGSTREER